MTTMKKYSNFFLCLLLVSSFTPIIFSQQMDIEGHSQLLGNFHICHMNDQTSINIGPSAGAQTDYSSTRANTFIGAQAGSKNTVGLSNTFLGAFSGAENLTGKSNTFIGRSVGVNNSIGSDNTFIGAFSGLRNTTANENCFYGSNAGINSTTGSQNVFMGYQSGNKNTDGWANIFIGAKSAIKNTTGEKNVVIGTFAAGESVDGNQNVYIGHSVANKINGDGNVYIGAHTGAAFSTGSKNTLIGKDAMLNDHNIQNATALGHGAVVQGSNQVRIGNTSISRIEGQVSFSSTSDRRLKEQIKPLTLGLDFVKDLNPVVYHRKENDQPSLEMGLIAQELMEVLSRHNATDVGSVHESNDGYLSVRYNDLFAPLIKAVQEIADKNLRLEELIEHQQTQISKLQMDLNRVKMNNAP